ncbi:MAG: AraC family transcriptional regulator [Acidobacteria bacterium]|nr:AraC family transcriptional regulator [Acidobacteriota bacterium]
MNYREVKPTPALAAHLECFWFAGDGVAPPPGRPPERILPDGCVEWLFHLGDPFRRVTDSGSAELQPQSFVVGELTRHLVVTPSGRVRTMGARFKPGGAYRFVPIPLGLLTDRVAPTADVWGADGSRIEDAVMSARSDGDRIRRVEAFLTAQGDRRAARPRLDAAVASILRSQGCARVSDLAHLVGSSPRQLEREFRSGVGLTPKGLARTIRFQNLMRLVGEPRLREWASLALDAGYADQSHMVREFREFAGQTPTDHGAAPPGDLARHFVSPQRLAALLGMS